MTEQAEAVLIVLMAIRETTAEAVLTSLHQRQSL